MAAHFVFELICDSRREIFVSTGSSVEDELARVKASPPLVIAHWPAEERAKLRIIETFSEAKTADEFARRYASTSLPKGWRYLKRL